MKPKRVTQFTMQRAMQALDAQWARKDVERVVVDLPLPISTNDLWGPGMVKTARYRSWIRSAGNMLNHQKPGRVVGSYSLTIIVNPRRSAIDLGNAEKAISDALQSARVIGNDKRAESITLYWSPEVEGCRAIVEKWQGVERVKVAA